MAACLLDRLKELWIFSAKKGAELKTDIIWTGDELAFWGTIGIQTTLPFGTPEEVRRVVKKKDRNRRSRRRSGY